MGFDVKPCTGTSASPKLGVRHVRQVSSQPLRSQDDGRAELAGAVPRGLEGEILVISPNVSNGLFWAHRVDFVLVAAKLA
jgi:hypothetical protein